MSMHCHLDTRLGLDYLLERGRQHLPNYIRNFPSMMIPDEKEILASIVEHFYSGNGLIVDAGIFLGASTHCFAEGLKRRGITARRDGGKPIQSFDMALCDHNMAQAINYLYQTNLTPGASFVERIEANLAGVAPLVDLHIGDITKTARFIDAPIEILFYDCGKTADVDDFVVRNLFPRLVPNKSILIQQDFFHEWLPWIHVSMGKLWDKFKYLGYFGTSAVFLCVDEIGARDVADCSIMDMSVDEADHYALVCAAAARDPGLRYMITMARAVLYGFKDAPEIGLRIMDGLRTPDDAESSIGFTLPRTDAVLNYLSSRLTEVTEARSERRALAG